MDRTKRPAGSTATGQIRRLLESGTASELTENQLLERFIAQGDEAAFALLVDRHGPMVIGVCRRFLRDPNDVDDAFQATFLILVRKAGSLRDRELLGNWLYGVACKVAHRARSSGIRQRLRFTSTQVDLVDPSGPTGTIPGASPSLETDMLIHEEISRLPQKYRSPIVLCYLEGLTHDEAASRLGWPVGTVKGRLSRARDLLRPRLARRGLALSTAALSSVLTVPSAEAAVTDMLAFSTIRAALATIGRAGPVAAGGPGISLSVQSLVRGVLNAMFLTKIKLMFVPALVVTAVAAGGATLSASRFGPQFFESNPRPAAAGPQSQEPPGSPFTKQHGRPDATAAPAASSEGAPATRKNEAQGTPAGASGGGGFGAFGGGGLEAPDPNEARITIARISAQIAATDKNPRNVAILKKLEEPVSLRFPNETPLEDVLKLIKKSGVKGEDGRSIPIYVDPTGLAEAEKTMTSPVVIDLDDVPLKFSLRLVLKQLGLAYCIRDGVLIISSVEGIQQELKEAQAEQMGMHPEQYPMGMGGMGGGTMGGMGGGMR